MTTRAQIVACARTYLGTPYRHQGRTKGPGPIGGMDCIGLPLCVAEELGLADAAGISVRANDHLDYGPQEVQGRVLDVCRMRLIEKLLSEPIEPGDVLVLRIPDVPTHAAIVTELTGAGYACSPPEERCLGMIHAWSGTINKVCENRIDEKWRKRIVAVFYFPQTDPERKPIS